MIPARQARVGRISFYPNPHLRNEKTHGRFEAVGILTRAIAERQEWDQKRPRHPCSRRRLGGSHDVLNRVAVFDEDMTGLFREQSKHLPHRIAIRLGHMVVLEKAEHLGYLRLA